MEIFKKEIKIMLDRYGDQEKKEIRKIQQAYRDHLGIENSIINHDPNGLPPFLQMNANFDLPLIYDKQDYILETDSSSYSGKLGSGELRNLVFEALGYICEYQRSRLERFAGKGSNYDPTNLFCEEFKLWLIQLSKVGRLDERIEKEVRGRLRYVEALKVEQEIFEPGKASEFTRLMLFVKLVRKIYNQRLELEV